MSKLIDRKTKGVNFNYLSLIPVIIDLSELAINYIAERLGNNEHHEEIEDHHFEMAKTILQNNEYFKEHPIKSDAEYWMLVYAIYYGIENRLNTMALQALVVGVCANTDAEIEELKNSS